jgi:hypothetical protein
MKYFERTKRRRWFVEKNSEKQLSMLEIFHTDLYPHARKPIGYCKHAHGDDCNRQLG